MASNTPQINAPASLVPFLKWGIAWGVLLFILTAMYDAGGGWDTLAMGIAGLLAFGAVYTMGPASLAGLQKIWR